MCAFDPPNTSWASEELFFDGDDFFLAFEKNLDGARQTIDLETYIFRDDVLGRRIAEALSQAAQRGVTVRLIVDAVGSLGWVRSFGPQLSRAGVSYLVFNELPGWTHLEFRRWPSSVLSAIKRFIRSINFRDHRKICIIDDQIAYLGSMNISSVHLSSVYGKDAWRDTGVRITGGDMQQLSAAFNRVWLRKASGRVLSWKKRLKKSTPVEADSGLVLLNDTRHRRSRHYRTLLRRIKSANSKVWITNSYFIPHGSLLRALRKAARAGVSVIILVPSKSDVFFIPWVTPAFYLGLLKAGVKIYEYAPSILHAKTLIVDEWAIVGSSNLNHRSLFHDLEADVVLSNAEAKESLERRFVEDLHASIEISFSHWRGQPFFKKLVGAAALVFRYFL